MAEGNSEAGHLEWPCPVSYSSEWDGTLLTGSHKPWVTTDRKVNSYFTRSQSKLHPLRQDKGLQGPALFANTELLTINDKIRVRRKSATSLLRSSMVDSWVTLQLLHSMFNPIFEHLNAAPLLGSWESFEKLNLGKLKVTVRPSWVGQRHGSHQLSYLRLPLTWAPPSGCP